MVRITFVCLGNICRSPLAEGIFQKKVIERELQNNYYIDSAGTSAYHIGELADPRSRGIARKYGIELTHRAQKFVARHLVDFDLVVAMDRDNKSNMLSISSKEDLRSKIYLMSDFDSSSKWPIDVPDPYFGGEQGFQIVYEQLEHSCSELLDKLEQGWRP